MQPLRVPRWILLLLWALAAGYAAYVAWTIGEGYRSAARGEMPLYTDYTPRYAASLLLQAAPAEYLYVPQAMIEAGREAARAIYGELSPEQLAGVGFAAWMFPPTFMLAVYPLALLPYWLSWIAWLAATAVPYLTAMRRILPAPLALPFALALPPTFYNVMYGQTGFLVGGLIALGLSQLGPRPWLAGVLIGLASVKPHFGVLIPLALLAGGCWRTFAAAALTVIALAGASLLAFGDEPWFAFIGSFLFHAEGLGVGAFNFVPMTSVLSAFRLAGASMAQAWQAQYLAAAAMALLVVWAWWRSRGLPRAHGLRCAMLCLATPLAIPMSYLYDLVLIAPAAAWLLADLLSRPRRTWELPLLAGALAAFLAVKPLARAELQLGTLLVAVLLGMTLRRFHGLCRERHG